MLINVRKQKCVRDTCVWNNGISTHFPLLKTVRIVKDLKCVHVCVGGNREHSRMPGEFPVI